MYLQLLIYCDVHIKLSLYLYYCNWRRLCNLHKERKILRNIFVGNILSKLLKEILGSLKSLICSEDTKTLHTTICQRKKLWAPYSTMLNNLKILDSKKTYKTKLSFETIYQLGFGKCNGKKSTCLLCIWLNLAWWCGFYDRCPSLQPYKNMTLFTQ